MKLPFELSVPHLQSRPVLGLGLMAVLLLGWNATAVADISLVPDADARLSNDTNRGPDSATGSAGTLGGQLWEVRWHPVRVRIGYLRYDISGIDPSMFSTATLSGTFRDGKDGPSDGSGLWNVHGLNDDVVANPPRQGNDWDEATVAYENAGGVNNSSPLEDFEFTDSTFLGTIALSGVDPTFESNTTDLDLTSFLNADTDGLVTFLISSASQDEHEYQVLSKESPAETPATLNFFESVGLPGDLNDDSDVDGDDFLLAQQAADPTSAIATWQANYPAPVVGITAVPEPSTCCMVLIALIVAQSGVRKR